MSRGDVDRAIAVIAGRQRGRVARRQLLAAGVSHRAIATRLELGRLHVLHPGVYAVGYRGGGDPEALIAAALFGGPSAVLSHRGAARYFGLGHFSHVDLTCPGDRRNRRDLVFHRGIVPEHERLERDGMLITTPARTLLDLCAVVPRSRMERVFAEAEVQGLLELSVLRRTLQDHRGRRGVRLLREMAGLGPELARGRIRSRLERRFRRLIADSGLPTPELNSLIRIGAQVFEVDALWRRQRVAVELDARSTHGLARFESDRERDLTLSAHGWRPVRVTDRRLDSPDALLANLRMLIRSR